MYSDRLCDRICNRFMCPIFVTESMTNYVIESVTDFVTESTNSVTDSDQFFRSLNLIQVQLPPPVLVA